MTDSRRPIPVRQPTPEDPTIPAPQSHPDEASPTDPTVVQRVTPAQPSEVRPTDPTVVQRRPSGDSTPGHAYPAQAGGVSPTDPTVVQRRPSVSAHQGATDPAGVQSVQAARARRQAGLANDPTIVARVQVPGADDPTTVVPMNEAGRTTGEPTMTVAANDPTVVVPAATYAGADDPTVTVPTSPSEVNRPTYPPPPNVVAAAPGVAYPADDPTVVASPESVADPAGDVPAAVEQARVVPAVDSWHPATEGGRPRPAVEPVGRSEAAPAREELLARLNELTEIRVRQPERIAEAWQRRRTRELVGTDGRLLIVAADHPARGALGVRDDQFAMGSRPGLIERLVTALERPGVDGVLATPDVLEDLLLLGALEGKVVIGSMNRGGLQGSSFELDDRFTAYGSAADIASRRLDGGKMLTRIDLADPGTVATLEASAKAVTELAEHKLMAMVEPFWSTRKDGRVTNVLDADSVIKSVHIAAGLGATSAYTWLKLPVVDNLDRVMDATTLPTLLLGGDPTVAPEETYARWGKALSLPSVRGLVVGRALLFPPDGNVAYAVDQAASLVHGGAA